MSVLVCVCWAGGGVRVQAGFLEGSGSSQN